MMINKHTFKWTITGMIFFTFIIAFRIFFGLTDYFLEQAPDIFFLISLIFLIGEVFSIYCIYKYNKIGVFLFPILLLLEISYYSIAGFSLIDNIVGIFWFIALGLLPIIPKWNELTYKFN